jgi:hypothetical protein
MQSAPQTNCKPDSMMHCACVFGDLVSLWSSRATVGTQHDDVNSCLLHKRHVLTGDDGSV